MALSGKKNHYNVKFLKGYGFSISVKDSKIILKNCADPFSEPETEEWFGNNMPYSKIVLSGKGYISTEALSLLSENNKNLILLDTYGKPVTYLNPVRIGEGLTATRYRIGQYDTFRDESKRKYLTERILREKKESQIRFLKLTGKPEMESYIKRLGNSSPNEAVFSRIYFDAYSKLIDPRFGFTKRNSYDIRKNKATDIINALLN